MIRIAADATCLAWGWGGIPKHLDRIARQLARRDDVEVTLLANASGPFTDIEGVRQVWRRVKGGGLWRSAFLAGWLVRHRPDVLWAPETNLPLRVPVPAVVTVHDLASVRFPDIKPWRHRLAFRTSLVRSTRRASRIIAVSQTTATDLEELWGIGPDRVTVIPNGVDEQFSPGDRAAAAAAVAARFGLRPPFVLSVGSLEPRKNLDTVVAAAAEAAARGLPLRFALAGAPGYRGDEVVEAARRVPACTVLGPVTDLELLALYRAADALLLPSRYEGFGMPALEAMACGTPVVVAPGAGALSEVAPGAIVAGSRRPGAWLDAIATAQRERERRAEAGVRAAARFRWAEVADATLSVLAAASGRPAPGD